MDDSWKGTDKIRDVRRSRQPEPKFKSQFSGKICKHEGCTAELMVSDTEGYCGVHVPRVAPSTQKGWGHRK